MIRTIFQGRRGGRRSVAPGATVVALLAAALALPLALPTAHAATAADGDSLYLVTLAGPGLSGEGETALASDALARIQAAQDQSLASAGVSQVPVYRWTEALNGYAVHLSAEQAANLAADPAVVRVEPDSLQRLAARPASGTLGGATVGQAGAGLAVPSRRATGGAGVVVGVIDSGLWPESPSFAGAPGLGASPRDFLGVCQTGAEWTAQTCNRKVVGARWFVDGFGADNIRSSEYLSSRDESGHGTQVASVAVGNAQVSVRAAGERFGTITGVAPQARLAVYKACWTAPDPDDDGCSAADVVTAIDQATADGVDVLNLSVVPQATPGLTASINGSDGVTEALETVGPDTIERALLGAAEGDVAVVAAAGNGGDDDYAAHASPWVTTVGATNTDIARGEVSVQGGPELTGAMASTRSVDSRPIVLGARMAVAGVDPGDAALCLPGSLDASAVAGAIVVCERGEIGRVDKSSAVATAGGDAMVLTNTKRGAVSLDIHAVPTVHVDRATARRLTSYLARNPAARATVSPDGTSRPPRRVANWSSAGDPTAAVVKPDLVAGGTGRLGAVPPQVDGDRIGFFSGTSAAAAEISGVAALVRSRHDWSASAVRSVLTTSARSIAGPALRQGAGRAVPAKAVDTKLALAVRPGAYRQWLDGEIDPDDLNTTSIQVDGGTGRVVTRRITNLGTRAADLAGSASGLDRHQVTVSPSTLRIPPGETRTFRVRISGPKISPLDDGVVEWRSQGRGQGQQNALMRIPVVLSR